MWTIIKILRVIRQYFCQHEWILLRHMDDDCNTFICVKCKKGMLG